MNTFFQGLAENIRFADVLDVGVISVLFYLGLSWLRRRTSRSIVVGLLLLGAVYAVARVLDMYLTLLLFRVGLTVILLMLALVFHQDIRRGIEGLAVFRRRGRRRVADEWIDLLVESATGLAERRIGALIAVEGLESLEGHIRGGVPLDGKMSIPLLYSIFHPQSPGHDGAVVVSGNRVRRFGVHLPLSANLVEVGPGGTRHTAALGLAERCDALVVVVSEERGAISVAEEGQIREIKATGELRHRLDHFATEHFPRPRRLSWPARARQASQAASIKLASVALAVMCWLLFAYHVDVVQRVVDDVPIEFRNLPTNWAVEDVQPAKVRLTLTGPQRAFAQFEPRNLIASIDLGRVEEGEQEIAVTPASLNLPADLSMRETDTPVVKLAVYPMVAVQLPVKPQLVGWLPDTLHVRHVKIDPPQVQLLVRRSDANDVESVYTEPIFLNEINQTKTIEAKLRLPSAAKPAGGTPTTVKVVVEVMGQPQPPVEKKPPPESEPPVEPGA